MKTVQLIGTVIIGVGVTVQTVTEDMELFSVGTHIVGAGTGIFTVGTVV